MPRIEAEIRSDLEIAEAHARGSIDREEVLFFTRKIAELEKELEDLRNG